MLNTEPGTRGSYNDAILGEMGTQGIRSAR